MINTKSNTVIPSVLVNPAVRHESERRTTAAPKLLEFGERYSDPEILERLCNCKILIGQQARRVDRQWKEARDQKETEVSLECWMVGVQIATVGPNDMLQLMYAGRLIDVMPCDLAELVDFDGLGYLFKVARANDTVVISSLRHTWIRY